jgi:hypothetical protein
MTTQGSPGVSAAGPAQSQQNVTFRMMTPVFNYQVEGGGHLKHSGQYGNARFEILLRPYQHNATDFDEVTRYCDESTLQMQELREFPHSRHFMQTANYVLLVDAIQPAAPNQNGSRECVQIMAAAQNALRLHSSGGLPSHHTYSWRSPRALHAGLQITSPNAYQSRFSHLGLLSVLSLAIEYHRVCFTLEHVEHAFLILMVAFEALFKKDETEKASKAAGRIGRLLGKSKKGKRTVPGRIAVLGRMKAFSNTRRPHECSAANVATPNPSRFGATYLIAGRPPASPSPPSARLTG